MTAAKKKPPHVREWRARLRKVRKDKNLEGVACVYEDLAFARRQEGAHAASRRAFHAAARAWRTARSALTLRRASRVAYDLVFPDSLRREAWCLAEVGSFSEARKLLGRVKRCRQGPLFAEEIQSLVKSFPQLA